jgi:hypothetical protein
VQIHGRTVGLSNPPAAAQQPHRLRSESRHPAQTLEGPARIYVCNPERALVNRILPKKKVYATARPGRALGRRILEQVEEINLDRRNWLARGLRRACAKKISSTAKWKSTENCEGIE